MLCLRSVNRAAGRSEAEPHECEGAFRDRIEGSAVFDSGQGRVQHSGDQICRERGLGNAELPDGSAERFGLFQVEFHQLVWPAPGRTAGMLGGQLVTG